MNRGIYALTGGMISEMERFKQNAYNMSNSMTAGHKANGINTREAREFQQYIIGKNGKPIGKLGSGPVVDEQYLDLTQGQLKYTGNEYDFALTSKDGMFAVRTENGIRLQRAGNFMLDRNRMLVNQDGNPVLDDGFGEIIVPQDVSISAMADGTLSPIGQRLGVFRGAERHLGKNLYLANNPEPIEDFTVTHRSVESSNFNTITGSIDMVMTQRQMQMSQNLIKQQEEENKQLIQSMN